MSSFFNSCFDAHEYWILDTWNVFLFVYILQCSDEGKVRKVLKVEPLPDGTGYFFNLSNLLLLNTRALFLSINCCGLSLCFINVFDLFLTWFFLVLLKLTWKFCLMWFHFVSRCLLDHFFSPSKNNNHIFVWEKLTFPKIEIGYGYISKRTPATLMESWSEDGKDATTIKGIWWC